MFHLFSSSVLPLQFTGGGYFINNKTFTHDSRTLDFFDFVLVDRGTLYITQDNRPYEISANQYILLFPGIHHFGHRRFEGQLSFYWCHFHIQRNNYHILLKETSRHLHMLKTGADNNYYLVPETGRLHNSERVVMLFRQLLDANQRGSYSEYLMHYALSLLAMEISADYLKGCGEETVSTTEKRVAEIMEWIRVNSKEGLSVARVAEAFNYNPNYLSNAFKKCTGMSLLEYITRTKIDWAKKLLLSSDDPVKNIAGHLGFADDKYFMKVFKRVEGVTPSQYRNAFYLKHMNDH